MARTTAGKLASKTAAAAKRVTSGVTRKGTPAKEAAPKNGTAKKSAPKKTAPKKAAPKKTEAKQSPAKKAAPKKAAPEKAAAKKTAPKKAAPKKAAPKKSAPTAAKRGAPAAKQAAATTRKATAVKKDTSAAKKAPAKKAPTKKSPTKKSAAKNPAATSAAKQSPTALAVKADEEPWTSAELDALRAELTQDADRLRGELDLATRELDDLMRDAGDGAGNDQADVGSTTFERDHEMSLANNARDMLTQTEHALERISDGTYGVCESCGQPIGKNRLMAFPRATLCLTCKQREERR